MRASAPDSSADSDWPGAQAAIDDMARSASLMAVSDATVTVIPCIVFHDILRQRSDVALTLLQLLSKRIRAMNDRLSELSFLDTKHRLYNTLLRLSRVRNDGAPAVPSF